MPEVTPMASQTACLEDRPMAMPSAGIWRTFGVAVDFGPPVGRLVRRGDEPIFSASFPSIMRPVRQRSVAWSARRVIPSAA